MANGREIPEPTELVYVPAPSWRPVLLAFGLVTLFIGLFAGWVYAVVGGIIALGAFASWTRAAGYEMGRLPRQQRITAAVLPAVPLRSTGEDQDADDA
jgi:hypothetical protein